MVVSPFEYADDALDALREITGERGTGALSDPLLLAGLLADLLPQAPAVIRVLVTAAEDRVADKIRDGIRQGLGADRAARLAAASFAKTSMLTPEVCGWVAKVFAEAGGFAREPGHDPTAVAPGEGGAAGSSEGHDTEVPGKTVTVVRQGKGDNGTSAGRDDGRRIPAGQVGRADTVTPMARGLGTARPGRSKWRGDLMAAATVLVMGAVGGVLAWAPWTRHPPPPPSVPRPAGLVTIFTDPGFANVDTISFSPDGRTLANGNYDGGAYLWDVTTKRLTATLAGSTSVPAVAFSPDGRTLAVGDSDGSAYLWQVAAKRLIAKFTAINGARVISAFSPNIRTIATSSSGRSTYLWQLRTGRRIATLTDPGGFGVTALAFSPDGRALAVGDGYGTTYLWDVATRQLAATLINPKSSSYVSGDYASYVVSVAFSPNGNILAVGNAEQTIGVWDAATGRRILTLPDPGSGLNSIAFSPNGRTLAVGDADGSTYLFQLTSRKLTATLTNPGSAGVGSLAFSPDGRILAVGDVNGKSFLWRLSRTS